MSTDITNGSYDTYLTATASLNFSLIALNATQAISLYRKSSNSFLYARVLDIAGDVITHVGAEYEITSFIVNDGRLVRLTDSKALILWTNSTPWANATVIDVSGSTITAGAHYSVSTTSSTFPRVTRISDTQALAVWRQSAGIKARVLTVAGTNITPATVYDVTASGPTFPDVRMLSSTQAVCIYLSDVTTASAEILDIAGTVITVTNSPATVHTNTDEYPVVLRLGDTQAIAIVRDRTSFDLDTIVLNVSGSSITPGTPLTGVALDAFPNEWYATALTDTNVLISYVDFNDSFKAKAVIVSDTGATIGNVNIYGAGSNDSQVIVDALTNAKVIATHRATGSNSKAIILETDPPAEPEDPPVPIPLPMLTASMLGGATMRASLPALTARLSGISPRPNTLDARLPALSASLLGGARLNAALPMLTAEMSGTTTIVMTLDVQLPMIEVSMSGTSIGTGSIAVTLPSLAGTLRGGGSLNARLPAMQASMTGLAGSAGSIDVTLPMLTAQMNATLGVAGIIEAVLPMLVAGPYGRIVSMLPMMQATLSGRTVVAVTYEAYAMGLSPVGKQKVNPVTRYTDQPFTGIVRWKDDYYGWGPGGLYLIGGDTDDGEPIAWAWKTAITNFGSRQEKRVAETFLHGRLGATVSASVSIGEAADVTYAAVIERGRTAQAHRIKYGRGLKAEYWSFGLADANGSEMAIDSMQHEPKPLSRKI